jgi:hypothetical protein
LLLGGWAVAIHGHPRATKDIDFLISIDNENLEKIQKALIEFHAPPVDIESLKERGTVIRMGVSPILIDIINKASGIDINECYKRREIIKYDNIEISVISANDLIINKRATGRGNDLGDAEKLENKLKYDKK